MATKPTYYELLRHPNWQAMRLKIMSRAEFKCERCGDKDTTLNVHHSFYEKGLKPWEYPERSLHCLCEPCHEYCQAILTFLHRMIGSLCLEQIEALAGNALGMALGELPNHEIDVSMMSEDFSWGVAEKWREVPLGALYEAIRQGKVSGDLLESLAKREDEERLEKWKQGSAE